MKKLKKAYTVQFNVLEKDLPKLKKVIEANRDILIRAYWTETKVQLI